MPHYVNDSALKEAIRVGEIVRDFAINLHGFDGARALRDLLAIAEEEVERRDRIDRKNGLKPNA